MRYRNIAASVILGICAFVLSMTPGAVALDFGGFLAWPQYISGLVVFGCLILGMIGVALNANSPLELELRLQSFTLSGLLLCLVVFVFFQTIPLPPSLVSWLSPASHQAHLEWTSPLIDSPQATAIPISVSPSDTKRFLSYLIVVTAASFLAPVVFSTRERLMWLLVAIGLCASSIAVIGILRKTIPGFDLWSFKVGGEGAPFGTFLNRNNAALGMNLGVATAVGLIVWRRIALVSDDELADGRVNFKRGLAGIKNSWLTDSAVMVAMVSLCICIMGLTACGSRGGLLSMAIAGVATIIATRRSMGKFLHVFITIGVVALLGFTVLRTDILGNQAIQGDTLQQLEATVPRVFAEPNGMKSGARLAHWPDGFRAAIEHLPFGSGMATYAFAYLPWQATSPWRWCIHADNLWLEMMLELGIPGMLLVAVLIWCVIQATRRLAKSPDPVDQGIRSMAIYAGVAVAVSQFFDFGLIAASNLLAVSLIAPLVFDRAAKVSVAPQSPGVSGNRSGGTLQLKSEGQSWWKSSKSISQVVMPLSFATLLLLMSVPALGRLRNATLADHFVRQLDQQLLINSNDLDFLNEAIRNLESRPLGQSSPEVAKLLSRLHFEVGRLTEITQMPPELLQTQEQLNSIYLNTILANRRLSWRLSDVELRDSTHVDERVIKPLPVKPSLVAPNSAYRRSLEWNEQLLRQRPLGLDARNNQVVLEFVHQIPARTDTAISQSSKLFTNNPELQFRFGRQAADHGNYDLAKTAWKRVTDLRPDLTRRVIGRAVQYPDFPVEDVIPNTSEAIQLLEKARRVASSK